MGDVQGVPARPKTWRRWFQFRLRTLLIAVLFLSLGLNLYTGLTRQHRAAQAIRRIHGYVRYDYELDPQTRHLPASQYQEAKNPKPPGPAWLRRWIGDEWADDLFANVISIRLGESHHSSLRTRFPHNDGLSDVGDEAIETLRQHLRDFPKLQGVWIIASRQLTDVGMEQLKEVPQLLFLDAADARITDAGLQHIAGSRNLVFLNLTGTRITDAGMVHLRRLTELRRLILADTAISDVGLAHLKDLANLQDLDLQDIPITDAGLAYLKGLTQLETLVLDGTQISGPGLSHLEGNKSLAFLRLNRAPITDAGLAALGRLDSLREVWLEDTAITDEGLLHLRPMPRLLNLRITRTRVTPQGAEHLRQLHNRSINVVLDEQSCL